MTIIGLLKAAALATAVASIVSLFGIKHHFVELFVHFRLQYLIASVLLLALFLFLGEKPYAALMFVSVIVSAWVIAPWYLGDVPTGGSSPVKLVHVNVQSANTRYRDTIDFVAEEDPDIVFVQEVSPAWDRELDVLSATYPYSYTEARAGNFGIAVYSKHAFDSVSHVDSPPLSYPTIAASMTIGGEPVTFVSTHPMIPVGKDFHAARNEQFASIEEMIAQLPGRIVLSGDMNASLWDPRLAEFEAATGLVNVRSGAGLLLTWPMFFPPAAIPIDHAMVSPGIGVIEARTGRRIGSDHLPLIVTLSL